MLGQHAARSRKHCENALRGLKAPNVTRNLCLILEPCEFGDEFFSTLTIVPDHLLQFFAVAAQNDNGWEAFDIEFRRQSLVGLFDRFGLLLVMRKIHVYQHEIVFGKVHESL